MTSAPQNYNTIITTIDATILSGQTTSAAIDVYGTTLKTIYMPAAFTGTKLNFKVSEDNVTFYDYANINNNLVEVTITAGRAYGLAAIDFASIQFLKLVSDASEAADRTIKLVVISV